MDPNTKRRSSIPSQSPNNPSSLRQCSYPSPVTTPQTRPASLRHSPKSKSKLEPPRPAALARIKGAAPMDSSSRSSTEMSWLNNEPSSINSSPRTVQTCRSRTPDLSNTTLVHPSSSLLQDLLKEQRATRGSRVTAPDKPEESVLNTPNRSRSQSRSQTQSQSQSQPQSQTLEDAASEKQRKAQMALASGLKQPREMGIREMDHYISKINKQNFDLKLEIFHRAQQMTILEKRLGRMTEVEEELRRMNHLEDELQELRDAEEDNLRLRESNEQLRREIDKRDQAVTEAVELICQLEARVEEIDTGNGSSTPSTARPDPNDGPEATTPRNTTFGIPERISSRRGTVFPESHLKSYGSRYLNRAPSFLREEHKSTAALRSLYAPIDEKARNFSNELTKTESFPSMNGTVTEPESPRLSALSECSELHPPESLRRSSGFDQIDIPIRKESIARESDLSIPQDDPVHIDCWIQPQPDPYRLDIPKQRHRPVLDTLKAVEKTSFESGSLFNSSSQRTQVDSVFGSSRLPPTPDTMSTAYAPASSGSNPAEKSHLEQMLAIKRGLRRPRSTGELTTRKSSGDSRRTDSLDPNVSETTLPRRSFDERDEDPAIFPLNTVTHQTSRLPDRELYHGSHFAYDETGDVFLDGDGMENVLSKMEKQFYSPSKQTAPEKNMSSSPPLSPQDWVEAAATGARPRKYVPQAPRGGPIPVDSRLVGARAPSQSSFLGRRHSIDSSVRDTDITGVPTLDLRSLDPAPLPEPELDRRRRLSLKPLFFSRSANARRSHSPMLDDDDKDDGAPAPTVRKTRQLGASKPVKLSPGNEERPAPQAPAHGDFSTSGPTYAADIPCKTLPHSFTESSLPPDNMPKSLASNSKDHKRRTSLGIFGWMKGASGLGSHSKKPDSDHPHPLPSIQVANGPTRDLKSTRLLQEIPLAIPETREMDMAAMNIAVEDFACSTRRNPPIDESPNRRPRYMERRSRRA
ncbi:hypothetical protein FE257_009410 [Aspergillus nanangensis]|uniref:Centrosomin N-terminal motif 1 domain-containing protein n=1 Tax=Aspergillus nanangensis TaxID=2582783 RepID=A0AAD4CK67_ASPNN|nr:hypothetical protein FE257_009410 [Aspergillus nanangensis]